LRTNGLVFVHDGQVLLAEEVVPLVRQSVGLEMARANRKRLYDFLSGADLVEVLNAASLKTSGTKDDKVERLLANYIQPTEVLQRLALTTLRDLCRAVQAAVTGSKDELVARLFDLFLRGLDQTAPEEPAAPPPSEPRHLDEARFRALFACCTSYELTDVLVRINSPRRTGTKDAKINALWQSSFSEGTLLNELRMKSLEDILARKGLKTSGSKRDRMDRLIDYFAKLPDSMVAVEAAVDREEQGPLSEAAVIDGESRPSGTGPHDSTQ
jgi:hypothetical protein